jgi:hypothetical protein
MIQPGEIKKEALRWYFDFLAALIQGESFFPKDIRFIGKIKPSETLKDFPKIQKDLENLRQESKDTIGYGYRIDFIKRKDKKIGEQLFPDRIYFDTPSDYLKFIGKEKEFERFIRETHKILFEIPDLKSWIINHPQKVIDNFEKWDDLLKVCKFFIKNPRPDLYIRELPLDISTKFVEGNQAIIRTLLDTLIADHINNDESDFEKRFNLKYREELIRIRILDEQLAKKMFFGVTDFSVPISQFVTLNITCKRVFVLENHTNFSNFSNIFNFLTLPHLADSIAIFGKGFQIGLLKNAKWLSDKQIFYWGDIDAHGFQILSQIRGYFPQTLSCMMDFETFHEFQNLAVAGVDTTVTDLANLTQDEHQLFTYLLEINERNRLEQEKIPHSYALKKIVDSVMKNS